MDPRKIMLCGDWHGNPAHTEYIFNEAAGNGVDAIVQVGDFGMWEHTEGGVVFLDLCAELVQLSKIPLYWIDGNHENHTLLRSRYGPGGDRHDPTPEGFWTIRPGVYYIPRGTRWVWNDVHIMGLGGAYSIDKEWRLQIEKNGGMQRNGRHGPPTGPLTQWWPEEELTDDEIERAINQSDERLDILLTHDKPSASNILYIKDLPECLPNQQRIQRVVTALRPKLLVHGHLHNRYQDQIRADGDSWTTVIGLDCDADGDVYSILDDDVANDDLPQVMKDRALEMLRLSWVIVDLDPEKV